MVYRVIYMKTIKQLSDDIGISKVSLYKLLKRDDIKAHVFKQDSVTVVDETGESLIKTYYSWEKNADVNYTVDGSVNENSQAKNEEMIAFLQEQLREKDNQINALLELLSNSQKLQVTQLLSVKSMEEAAPAAEKKKKPCFLRDLFLHRWFL